VGGMDRVSVFSLLNLAMTSAFEPGRGNCSFQELHFEEQSANDDGEASQS
jgi:hypothetical protein